MSTPSCWATPSTATRWSSRTHPGRRILQRRSRSSGAGPNPWTTRTTFTVSIWVYFGDPSYFLCVSVVIYRCRDMADNCGMCLALAKKYDCGWCQSSDRCEVKDQCERGSAIWLNRSQTCPNPEVTSFSPALGPWEGGTNITIQGINLGKTFQDIYTGVMIAGINCQPYEHLYIKTKQIVCKVSVVG